MLIMPIFRYASRETLPKKFQSDDYAVEITHETNSCVENFFRIAKHDIVERAKQAPSIYCQQMSDGIQRRLVCAYKPLL